MDIYQTPAYQLRDLLKEKKLNSSELIQLLLDRAEQDQNSAWITLDKNAKPSSDAPLYGLPIAVTDSIAVLGMTRTYGSLLLKDNLVTEDDPDIAQLKKMGAVILGKTNLSEFGFSDCTENKLQKPTLNPLTKRVCLGGSGGSAVAVATGSIPLAISQDSIGNLRLSAADCKLFGLKFTKCRAPICNPSFKPPTENHFLSKGVIARHPKDIQMIVDALQFDKDPVCCCPVGDLPKSIGCFGSIDIPDYKVEKIQWPFDETIFKTISSILACDRYLPLLALKQKDPNFLDLMDEVSCEWFHLAKDVSGIDYSGALCFVQWVQDVIHIMLSKHRFLISKVIPEKPSASLIGNRTMLFPFNISGHPALVTPSGHQIIGHFYEEKELLEFAEKYFIEN